MLAIIEYTAPNRSCIYKATPMVTIPTQPAFEEHLTSAFQNLRRSLDDAITGVGVAPSEPQDVARRLGVNRNLTWKVSKVVCSPDLYHALQHLPGSEGLDIFLGAVEKAGGSAESVAHVRKAQVEFDRVIELHTGDRATLELILDSMGGVGSAERLEQSRKLAFRGNSGVWGAQARVRATMVLMSPNADNPDKLDSGMVGGVFDFRRLRPNIRWPMFRPRWFHDDGTPWAHLPSAEAFDPTYANTSGPKLIGDFCSSDTAGIVLSNDSRGQAYVFEDGPIGNVGATTCVFGTVSRSVFPRYRTAEDAVGDLTTQILMPVESLMFDVVLHKDLEYKPPEVIVRGHLDDPSSGILGMNIPIGERARELPGRPPVVATSLVPRYEELFDFVFERLSWNRRDFRVWRLTLAFPPMHSTVMLRFQLPERP